MGRLLMCVCACMFACMPAHIYVQGKRYNKCNITPTIVEYRLRLQATCHASPPTSFHIKR